MSSLNLNNTENINADSIFLVVGNEFKNIYDIFATIDDLSNVSGIDQNIINDLTNISNQLPSNTDWYQNILDELNLRAFTSLTYSRTYIDNLIENYYTKGQVNNLTGDKFKVTCSVLEFGDVSNLGLNNLNIIGGNNGLTITDSINNQLMILNNTLIEIKKPLKCFEPVEFVGDCIIPNYLNVDQINALINGLSIPPQNQHTINCANINFLDVDSTGQNIMNIIRSFYIHNILSC